MEVRYITFLLLACTISSISAQWMAHSPGGATKCAKGDPYSFFYKTGTSGRLSIYFEGGGACWDSGSCLLPEFTSTVDVDLSYFQTAPGLMAVGDTRSAIRDDTILYIPYCTGDAHTGNNTANYGLYTINHLGRVNTDAALDFIQTIIPEPKQLNILGCSAGSLGAFLNAPFIFKRFPNTPVRRVWGDSEVGIVSKAQWAGAWSNWKMEMPIWIPGLDRSITEIWTPSIAGYIIVQSALYYGSATSQWTAYSSNADGIQTLFYQLGGGKDNWTNLMRSELAGVYNNATNTGYFVAPGNAHCVSDKNTFFTAQSNGKYVFDWVNDILNGPSYARTVDCQPNC